jgi:hypothetical protein
VTSTALNARELGQTALVGWREKVANGIAHPVSSRTGVGEEAVRATIGVLFFALSVYYVASTLRRALEAARS